MRIWNFGRRSVRAALNGLRRLRWRGITANLLMLSFIMLTSVGAAMLLPAAGFITAGICCGLFGYLLGSE